jgi:mannose-6-phosphate isomerase-like protein (cupin superfamily)
VSSIKRGQYKILDPGQQRREGPLSSPFILAPGEQHPGAPPRGPHGPFIRVASGHTGGLMALGEVTLLPRTPGPHLHVHSREDEMFFVLEGVLTVQIGEDLHDIAAGGLAWGARGTPHGFANRGPDQARIMIMWIPGGAEGVFAEMEAYRRSAGEPRTRGPWPQSWPATAPPR